jgi:hypothetical protein
MNPAGHEKIDQTFSAIYKDAEFGLLSQSMCVVRQMYSCVP